MLPLSLLVLVLSGGRSSLGRVAGRSRAVPMRSGARPVCERHRARGCSCSGATARRAANSAVSLLPARRCGPHVHRAVAAAGRRTWRLRGVRALDRRTPGSAGAAVLSLSLPARSRGRSSALARARPTARRLSAREAGSRVVASHATANSLRTGSRCSHPSCSRRAHRRPGRRTGRWCSTILLAAAPQRHAGAQLLRVACAVRARLRQRAA